MEKSENTMYEIQDRPPLSQTLGQKLANAHLARRWATLLASRKQNWKEK